MGVKCNPLCLSIRFILDMNFKGWYFDLISFKLTQRKKKDSFVIILALKRAVFVKKCGDCPFYAQPSLRWE